MEFNCSPPKLNITWFEAVGAGYALLFTTVITADPAAEIREAGTTACSTVLPEEFVVSVEDSEISPVAGVQPVPEPHQ